MIFDTHAHYDDSWYDSDRESLLNTLREYGVHKVMNVCAEMESLDKVIGLARKYPFVYATAGVHPDGTEKLTEEDMLTVKRAAKGSGNKIMAIGEIGLDYYRDDCVPREIQKKWFIRQLELSNELELPAVIHSRDAAQDTYDILKEYKPGEGQCVIHCFSYGVEMAKRFLDLGYYIALGGVVTFKNGKNAKEVAKMVPDDKLLLETDCPYLSPVPHRGERNFSGYLPLVVTEIAGLRGISEKEAEEMTYRNALQFYRIKE